MINPDFKTILCSVCFESEERYYARSTDPHCSFCGAFLNGQPALTAEEWYNQMKMQESCIPERK